MHRHHLGKVILITLSRIVPCPLLADPFLPGEAWKPWLDARTSLSDLQSMLTPYPADLMEAWPVTRRVNQRGFESPECILPVVPEQGELGLNLKRTGNRPKRPEPIVPLPHS